MALSATAPLRCGGVMLVALMATIVPRTLAARMGESMMHAQVDTTTLIADTRRPPSRPSDNLPRSFRLQPYGSDANFNPASVLVNRGLDIWQLDQYSPSLVRFPYEESARSVWRTLTHPREGIDEYGFWSFMREQILPLDFTAGQPAWLANYALHFFQGGVTYVRLEGWFMDRHVPLPKVWSGATVLAAAYLTEMAEAGYEPAGARAFADLVVFDVGGVLVFSIPWVRNTLGNGLRMMDWSLQPVFTPHGEVYNQGDYITFKLGLPLVRRVDFLARVGMGAWFGLSFNKGQTDAISFAVGRATLSKHLDETAQREFITMGIAGGVFYDRNGSLLAALESGMGERLVSLNIYPNVLPGPFRNMGLWLSLDRQLRPRLGLTLRALGMGIGLAPQGPTKYDAQQERLGR